MNKETNPFIALDNQSIKYSECVEYLKGCSESEVKEAVDNLVNYVEKSHRYSMSRIYSLWNHIFSRNETPQSCASCLIRKERDLRQWKEKQELESKLKEAEAIASQSKEIINETGKRTAKKQRKES